MTTTSRAAPGVCDQTSGEARQCAARRQALPEPADCNWPDCGCDPHATKVIEALLEQGWSGPRVPQPNLLGRETVRESQNDSIKREIAYDQILTLARELGDVTEKLMASEKERRALARKSAKNARALAALQPSKLSG